MRRGSTRNQTTAKGTHLTPFQVSSSWSCWSYWSDWRLALVECVLSVREMVCRCLHQYRSQGQEEQTQQEQEQAQQK